MTDITGTLEYKTCVKCTLQMYVQNNYISDHFITVAIMKTLTTLSNLRH